MTYTRIETAVALLRSRDDTIAAQAITIREQAITIRHLKALLAQADAELAKREQMMSDLMVESWAR